MDAVRIRDDEMVMLKAIDLRDHPTEIELAQLFSSEPLKSHPKNHCVPILEVIPLPDRPLEFILVMPFLRSYVKPCFETIGEAVEFFRQIFEVCVQFR